MILTRALRLLAIVMVLFASLIGARAAQATDCHGSGVVTTVLSPCPLNETIRYGTSIDLGVDVGANKAYPTRLVYILLTGDTSVIKSGSFFANFTGATRVTFGFSTPPAMGVGRHSGTLQVNICQDRACKIPFSSAPLPYSFDVEVPPSISSISPGSSEVRGPAFTLKLTGRFTPDCKIHLGSNVLTTRFVSSAELTATVDLASVTTGRDYAISVVSADGLTSNNKTFILENPVPVVSTLGPATVAMGAAPFTLTVTGKKFVPGSKIKIGTAGLTTKYVSSTELTAQLDLSTKTVGGAYDVSVSTPAPGGGSSASLTLDQNNNVPVITSLSRTQLPIVALATEGFFIQGTNLQGNSVVQVGGVVVPSTYLNTGTQVELSVGPLPSSAFTVGADEPVVVSNPAPGGGPSNALMLELDNPAPSMHWMSPVQAYAGSGDLVLTVRASSLDSITQLEWNGTPLQNVTSTTVNVAGTLNGFLKVTVPQALLATAGNATVALVTAGPGGGTSSATFSVITHPPEIDSLSPGFVAPGGGDFTLTLDGQDFDSSATVFWNGDQLTVTQLSASEIQVTVPAAEIMAPGVAKLTVVNPVAAGGTSVPATFAVDASGTSVQTLAQPVNDIEWDPWRFVLYGTTHAADPNYPRDVISMDPVALGVVAAKGTSPTVEGNLLSLSGDGRKLYVSLAAPWGIDSYDLPAFTLAGNLVLFNGGFQTIVASGIQASPLYSHVVAVNILPNGLASSNEGASVYDDSDGARYFSQNETWDAMAWSLDGLSLYGGDTQDSPKSFMNGAYDVTKPIGTLTFQSTGGLWVGGPMHVDAASGLVYADNSTVVIDPTGPSITSAVYPVSGVMIPDSSLGCAYFITQTAAQVTAAAGDWTLSCYSTSDQTLTRSIVIPSVTGTPKKLMRWGNEGLVFITDGGMIYFVSGQVVTGN